MVALLAGGAAVALGGGVWAIRRGRRPAPGEAATAETTPAPWRDGLASMRQRLARQWGAIVGRDRPVAFDELEEMLVAADVGLPTTEWLLTRVREQAGNGEPAAVRAALRAELLALIEAPPPPDVGASPWVVLVVGVNGVGKTTTVGKLTALHQRAGRKVLLVAGDTFRAAAIDQLQVWAERTGADIVRHAPGGDPSAVVYDGLRAAVARHADVVLIDSAGRLHTRDNLMGELAKLRRVIGREIPGAPHETLLVLDSTTGQNAVSQAKAFVGEIGATGIIMTKLDGTAKGGVLFAIQHQLGVPVRYVGVGEGIEDLEVFDGPRFVDLLFDETAASA